ncbi:MAG: FAD binding domain-containing protein [Acidobacteria bacterium]|nr:FAD binding domain-containing protein [Acidobacteriota bacterium]
MSIRDKFDLALYDPQPAAADCPQGPITAAGGYACFDSLPPFEYVNAESVAEAVTLLRTHGAEAALIAGGQDLLRRLRNRVHAASPRLLVNIKTVAPKLDAIVETGDGVQIGALATLRQVESSSLVRERYSLLAQAVHAAGPLQYRNRATLGGDLCQQVRCWYYQASGNAYPCRRKGGSECPALEGDNRQHAIFGSRDCVAVCASDTAPALVALGASVRIAGPGGERTVAVEDFFTARGNVLAQDEMVTGVHLPFPESGSLGVFEKFTQASLFDPAVASIAVVLRRDHGVCGSARIAFGAVSPAPWRSLRAEGKLAGERLGAASAGRAAEAAVSEAWPLECNGYKVDIVRVLMRRAVLALARANSSDA